MFFFKELKFYCDLFWKPMNDCGYKIEYASNHAVESTTVKSTTDESKTDNEKVMVALENLGRVINDVSIHILNNCDFQSFMQFSKTSKYFYRLCHEKVFPYNCKGIILDHTLRNISYLDYLKEPRNLPGALMSGIATTFFLSGIGCAMLSYYHYLNIPEHNPTEELVAWPNIDMTQLTNPHTALTMKYLQLTMSSLGISGGLITRNLFCASRIELDGVVKQRITLKTNLFTKIFSPEYVKWKINRINKNISTPQDWKNDAVLKQSVCKLSSDFALFPVVDLCGHTFDYRKINRYMQENKTHECPISKETNALMWLRFDTEKFNMIKNRMDEINS